MLSAFLTGVCSGWMAQAWLALLYNICACGIDHGLRSNSAVWILMEPVTGGFPIRLCFIIITFPSEKLQQWTHAVDILVGSWVAPADVWQFGPAAFGGAVMIMLSGDNASCFRFSPSFNSMSASSHHSRFVPCHKPCVAVAVLSRLIITVLLLRLVSCYFIGLSPALQWF